MPLSLPNLDDRRYDDLVREALAMIPAIAPQWTNHNAADPGITLVEMLAYLTEILIYRTNQIGDRQLAAFVALLTGRPALTSRPIDDQVRDVVLEIRRPTRAVTADDYETLALEAAHGQAARAHCLPGHNLSLESADTRRPGSVSVVILPAKHGANRHPLPTPELLSVIRERMEDARLVTTRLHLVGPRFVPVRISATVALKPEASAGAVEHQVRSVLEDFLDAYPGPVSGEGWTFGRDVFTSELFDLMERQAGVDYVAKLELGTDEESRIRRNAAQEVTGVDLWENELPRAEIRHIRVIPSNPHGEE